ncbi:MAG: hypothetical protein HQM09_11295 [Candidatus Riflebacteria bacterium]|nr:hypothetical protein [Candidatus Riflebacteria bacterium]
MKRCLPFLALFGLFAFPMMVSAEEKAPAQTAAKADVPAPAAKTDAAAPAATLPEKLVDVQYKLCPIKGKEAKPEFALIYDGKVYHFCCKGCIPEFTKDPKAAIAKIKDAKEVPLTITNKDGKCPQTGEPAKADVFSINDNKITFYCCPACIKPGAKPGVCPDASGSMNMNKEEKKDSK